MVLQLVVVLHADAVTDAALVAAEGWQAERIIDLHAVFCVYASAMASSS